MEKMGKVELPKQSGIVRVGEARGKSRQASVRVPDRDSSAQSPYGAVIHYVKGFGEA